MADAANRASAAGANHAPGAPRAPGEPGAPGAPGESDGVRGAGTLLLTVTPNPSLDLLFDADRLVWDDANRMADPRRRAGGQGINATRAVRALGAESTAVALLGGRTGAELESLLLDEATPLRAVPAAGGDTRTFVAVREDATGRSLLLNARGPARTQRDEDALETAVADALRDLRPAWVAGCGSLPAGFDTGFYARIAILARRAGAKVVIDCDGEPLRQALDAGCDLLVPNHHEARRLTGLAIASAADAAHAAGRLRERGIDAVAITLGADGAVFSMLNECWLAAPPAAASGSAVGAGDAFLAGLIVALERGRGPAHAVAAAVAAGTAVLRSRGAELLDAADVAEIAGRIETRPVR